MKTFLSISVCLVLAVAADAQEADEKKRLAELDAYWAEVSRAVGAGDFEGYAATCHKEGVLVSGTKKTSQPLSDALARWKPGIENTKTGELKASVEFRFSQRFGDATTAHETGMFLYSSGKAGEELKHEYIHFEALLVKREKRWKILMEYQKSQGTRKEWDLLAARNPAPPNIVLILADDLGYGDLGCFGQEKIKTPRLDQMAREGIRLTSHYSGHNVCSPSRCALMTGKHMGHASVTGNGGRLKANDVTVAMLLKQAGYKTCMVGKWGLVGRPGHPGSPSKKGFDHFFGFDNQGFAHFYYPEFLWRNSEKVLFEKNHDLRVNGEYKPGEGTYSHDELTSEALTWIKQNKDNPFFLYVPYCIPHAELTVPEDSLAPYRKLDWPEKPKLVNVGNNGGGGYGSQYKEGYCGQSHPHATYAGMISRMDRSIGKILDLLDELKLSENTLVIFSSDNGPSPEGGQTLEFFKSAGSLSGAKRSWREGGIRVPTIARWPGKISPGRNSDHPSAFWDFLPTACDVAGIEAPEGIDGLSYLPELLGKTDDQPKHEYLFWPGAIRSGNWKIHRFGKNRFALYDLENDIAEKNNVAAEHPEVVARLSNYFDDARKPSPKR